MAIPKWTAATWRQWFFEVLAPNGSIRPLRPLPMTGAETLERAEHQGDKPETITRLNIDEVADRAPRN
jgi:hypothetical protein